MNVLYREKGLPNPKTTWRLNPALKLFKVHSLIHNSLSCHKFLFRKLSAFLHFIFISADLAAFGCCLILAVVFQNHFQNWITFFAHFRPLNTCNKQCRIINPLKVLRKTPASPRFTKLAWNDFYRNVRESTTINLSWKRQSCFRRRRRSARL